MDFGRGYPVRLAAAAAIVVAAATCSAAPAGQFLWVRGAVSVSASTGGTRLAVTGDSLNEGDTIRTGADGVAQIRFVDRGLLSVRPDTELELRRYAAGDDPRATGTILMSLARGGVRSVTGLIGKLNPAGYAIETPVAVLGVRGTDHETWHIPPGTDGGLTPGTYDHVHEGATVLRTPAGTLELRAGESGFVGIGERQPMPLAGTRMRFPVPPAPVTMPLRPSSAAPALFIGTPDATDTPSRGTPLRAPANQPVRHDEPTRTLPPGLPIAPPTPQATDPGPLRGKDEAPRPVWEVLSAPARRGTD